MTDTEADPGTARMRPTLVRFGEAQFQELKTEARLAGVSVAEFVRQAVAAWSAHQAGLRDGYGNAHAHADGNGNGRAPQA